MAKAMTPEMFSTYAAYKLVKEGLPFRDAYKKIGAMSPNYPMFEAKEVLAETNHEGAPGNLGLSRVERSVYCEKKWWQKEESNFKKALSKLTQSL
ncbi:hypothetical protein HY214_04295 [Candidatus Roizmanbacteria bacterium]|nr:hypothetical protein [Candidatus Roizmanbacteria bacterium]